MEVIVVQRGSLGCTISSSVTLSPRIIMTVPHLSLAASSDFIDRLCQGETEKTRAKVIQRILEHERAWFTGLAIEYLPDWIIEVARKGEATDRFKEAQEWTVANGFRMLMQNDRRHFMWQTAGAMICLGSLWVEKENNVIKIYST